MDYISVKEAAALWKIDTSRVGRLARAGRIEGAKIVGRNWLIPKNAKKPSDGRTRKEKAKIEEPVFRFPLYVNDSESDNVTLSEDEAALRRAELDFFACEFKKAEKALTALWKSSENIYVRIMSVFFLCYISGAINQGNNYGSYFMHLELELAKDFPRRPEMELLRPLLFAYFTQYSKAAENFDFNISYDYSPSVYPIITYLSCMDKTSVEHPEASALRAELYELEIKQLTCGGYMLEAQLLHLAMFIFYLLASNEEKELYHLKCAVEIAYKYNFIFYVADAYPYHKAAFNIILGSYPREFADRVKQSGLKIDKSFSAFTKKYTVNDMFFLLSNNDIKYVLYASGGYSYRQVAEIVGVSERTVANRYAEIYEKLGIAGKPALLKLIKKSF